MRRFPMTDRWPMLLTGLLLILLVAGPAAPDQSATDANDLSPAPDAVEEAPAAVRESPRTHGRSPRAVPIDLDRELASQFIRNASRLLADEDLTIEAISIAEVLALEAVELDPDNPESWHFLLSVATLNESEQIRVQALERLRELEPSNDRIQLQLLRKEVEQAQTAAARAAMYERMIQRDDVPDTVKSRLALDLAVLERRRGRTESFATWLAESVALDRAHTAAAALAAGYFRVHVDDPVGTGELLLNQFLANPTDISAQVLAANHFLEHGAYAAAERLLSIAVKSYESIVLFDVPGELIADLAIAWWGAGRPDAALERIADYQRRRNVRYRERLLIEEPELRPMDRAARQAPAPLSVAVTDAALRISRGSAASAQTVQQLLNFYEQNLSQAVKSARDEGRELAQEDIADLSEMWMEAAWLAVWLGPEPERGVQFLEKAAELREISDRARSRILGWVALRKGDYDRAEEWLKPLAEEDTIAGLGYAHLHLAQGRKQRGAREMLRVARSQPGTLIGVWANDRLASLLGRHAPLSRHAAELDALVRDLPRQLDRLPVNPTATVSVRSRPASSHFRAYEPIIVNIEITNHSTFPLAIDPDGPITPEVVLIPEFRFSGVAEHEQPDPIVVSIDRRIRLAPRERITIPIDIRRTTAGYLLDRYAIAGAIASFRTISNFYITPTGSIVPNLLGSDHQTSSISIDGKRLTGETITQLIQQFVHEPDQAQLPDIALVMHALIAMSEAEISESDFQWLVQALLAITDGMRRLDPISQSWPLWILPTRSAAVLPFLQLARHSEHSLVQMSMLLFGQHALEEEEVQAYRNHDNQRVRRLARIVSAAGEGLDLQDEEDDEVDEVGDTDRQRLLERELERPRNNESD